MCNLQKEHASTRVGLHRQWWNIIPSHGIPVLINSLSLSHTHRVAFVDTRHDIPNADGSIHGRRHHKARVPEYPAFFLVRIDKRFILGLQHQNLQIQTVFNSLPGKWPYRQVGMRKFACATAGNQNDLSNRPLVAHEHPHRRSIHHVPQNHRGIKRRAEKAGARLRHFYARHCGPMTAASGNLSSTQVAASQQRPVVSNVQSIVNPPTITLEVTDSLYILTPYPCSTAYANPTDVSPCHLTR